MNNDTKAVKADDIRNQYPITYTFTNTQQDGRFRAIQVTAKAQHGNRLRVRTRSGYYASLQSQPLPMSDRPHENPY